MKTSQPAKLCPPSPLVLYLQFDAPWWSSSASKPPGGRLLPRRPLVVVFCLRRPLVVVFCLDAPWWSSSASTSPGGRLLPQTPPGGRLLPRRPLVVVFCLDAPWWSSSASTPPGGRLLPLCAAVKYLKQWSAGNNESPGSAAPSGFPAAPPTGRRSPPGLRPAAGCSRGRRRPSRPALAP